MGQNLVCCPSYTLPCPNDLELKAALIWVTDVVVMEFSSLYPSHAKKNCRLFELIKSPFKSVIFSVFGKTFFAPLS